MTSPYATGGVITEIIINREPYYLHTFNSNGTFTLNYSIQVNVGLVGGGGGGGDGFNNTLSPATPGAGGGAGGAFSFFLQNSDEIGDYKIEIGSGGSNNSNGGDTKIYTPDSNLYGLAGGGGYGGSFNINKGDGGNANDIPVLLNVIQGSGGGAATALSAVGNGSTKGGSGTDSDAGGGGGAVSFGGGAIENAGGNGGSGITFPWNVTIAGGGGGAKQGLGQDGGGNGGGRDAGNGGTANPNSGAGGGGGDGDNNGSGGYGADGVVFFCYYANSPLPSNPGLYFEPHQLRSVSGRASNLFRHAGRGLPNYQTEWMDSLIYGGGGAPRPSRPPRPLIPQPAQHL
jgi:hypothetical protein